MEVFENQHVTQTPPFPRPPALSEDDIKRAFVPFLRKFYKDRYAILHGSVQSTLDNRSEEGYIADGKIQFVKKDDPDSDKRELFTATFEATSLDKADEVKFRRNDTYLAWDSAAFAAMFTAGFYVLSFLFREQFLHSLGWAGNLGLLIGAFLMFFSGWFFVVRGWKKYRYIYAIEQFKHYFADEQWVVLAEDVFPSAHDPYLAELKNQCVFNGFGLAIVQTFDRQVRPVATPSRLGIYGKDRRTAIWLSPSRAIERMVAVRQKTPPVLTQMFNRLWRPFDYLLAQPIRNALGGRPEAWMSGTNRFMKVRGTQKMLAAISLLVMAIFFQKTLAHKDLEYADEGYEAMLDRRLAQPNPENYRGFVQENSDDATPTRPGAIPKQYPPNTDLASEDDDWDDDGEDVQTINLSGDEDEIGAPKSAQPAEYQRKTSPKPAAARPKPKAAKPAPPRALDVCSLVRNKQGWLVQDGLFSQKNAAEQRIAALKHHGLPCAVVWRGCLERGAEGYWVVLGSLVASEKTAKTERDNFQKTLQRYGLEKGRLALRRVN